MYEAEALGGQQRRQVLALQLQIVKIGESIHAGDRMPIGKEPFTQVRSDEPGTPGD